MDLKGCPEWLSGWSGCPARMYGTIHWQGVAADVRACCLSRSALGRAVPSAPRGSEAVRNVRLWATSPGALGTARPTFKHANDLGNTPVSRRILSAGKMAPTDVGGYATMKYPG
jgi:hypothetical protein